MGPYEQVLNELLIWLNEEIMEEEAFIPETVEETEMSAARAATLEEVENYVRAQLSLVR